MNWVDLLIVAAGLASALVGMIRGAAFQVLSYLGFGLGLLLGAALAPPIGGLFSGAAARGVSAATVFGLATGLTMLGRHQSKRLVPMIRRLNLGPADSAVGAGFGIVATLLTSWLLGGIFAPIDVPPISRGIHESRVMRGLFDVLPPAPPMAARIQRFLVPGGLPPVFAELEPSPAPGVPVASDGEVKAASKAARAAVVRVVASGCGKIMNGSGFIAGPDLIVTNAHVIAGVDRPLIEDRTGMHRATPVLFDPDMDLAVLRAGVKAKPLPLVRSGAPRGERGALLGFPGGGPFHAEPGAVLERFDNVEGRGIYSRDLVTRQVYQLKAQVRSGNSGGPFVKPSGEVVGVVFSASAINPQIGYALTSSEVAGKLDEARGRRQSVDTGPCRA